MGRLTSSLVLLLAAGLLMCDLASSSSSEADFGSVTLDADGYLVFADRAVRVRLADLVSQLQTLQTTVNNLQAALNATTALANATQAELDNMKRCQAQGLLWNSTLGSCGRAATAYTTLTTTLCNANNAGLLKFAPNDPQICDGSAWFRIASDAGRQRSTPASSCDKVYAYVNGVYWLTIGGLTAQGYCNFSSGVAVYESGDGLNHVAKSCAYLKRYFNITSSSQLRRIQGFTAGTTFLGSVYCDMSGPGVALGDGSSPSFPAASCNALFNSKYFFNSYFPNGLSVWVQPNAWTNPGEGQAPMEVFCNRDGSTLVGIINPTTPGVTTEPATGLFRDGFVCSDSISLTTGMFAYNQSPCALPAINLAAYMNETRTIRIQLNGTTTSWYKRVQDSQQLETWFTNSAFQARSRTCFGSKALAEGSDSSPLCAETSIEFAEPTGTIDFVDFQSFDANNTAVITSMFTVSPLASGVCTVINSTDLCNQGLHIWLFL